MSAYPTQRNKELIHGVAALKDETEITGFFRDLLTPAEIEEFSKRFYIAKLLWTTCLPYAEIAKKVNTSTTTVTRVSQWLFKESWQGYATILGRIYGKSLR